MNVEVRNDNMTAAMWEKVEYYTAHALSGILANPHWQSIERQKYLRAKDLGLEQLAILSAIEVVEKLELAKEKLTAKSPNLSVIDTPPRNV